MAASIKAFQPNIHNLGTWKNFPTASCTNNCTNQIPTLSKRKAPGVLTSRLFLRSLVCLLSLLQEIKRSPVWPEYSRKSFLTKELEEAWGFPYPLFGDYVDFKFRGGEGAGIHGKKVSDHVGKTQPYRNPIWTYTMTTLLFAKIPDGAAVWTPCSDKLLRTH